MWNIGRCVFLFLMGALSLIGCLYYRFKPHYAVSFSISQTIGDAVVYREANGIPHIYGDNEEISFFALGYVHAQDRVWQLELRRRLCRGELSELFGERALRLDIGMRKLNLVAAAEKDLEVLSPRARSVMQNHADGINHFIENMYLPLEFTVMRVNMKPWTLIDELILQKLMYVGTAFDWNEELVREFLASALNNSTLAQQILPVSEHFMTKHRVEAVSDEELKQSGLF